MKKIFLPGLVIFSCLTINCQNRNMLVIKELKKDLLPMQYVYPGEFIEAKKSQDVNGENTCIFSKLGPFTAPDNKSMYPAETDLICISIQW